MPQALSNRYANALADAVLAPATNLDAGNVSEQLHSFEQTIQSVPELKNVLLSPAVPTARKRSVIERLSQSLSLARLVRNFLFVLVDRRRAHLLAEIATAFDTAIDERLGLIRAEVTSAAPLSELRKIDVQAALSEVADRKVRCQFHVDESLIGGIVARIGSTVYDGSVRTRLQTMRQVLVS